MNEVFKLSAYSQVEEYDPDVGAKAMSYVPWWVYINLLDCCLIAATVWARVSTRKLVVTACCAFAIA